MDKFNVGPYLLFASALFFLLTGCAGKETAAVVPAGVDKHTISMELSNFDFHPSLIQARQGDTLVLHIRNATEIEHNITIETPDGTMLVSRDIQENQSLPLTVLLSEPGTYHFYCDKTMHPLLGMKGRIEVRANSR